VAEEASAEGVEAVSAVAEEATDEPDLQAFLIIIYLSIKQNNKPGRPYSGHEHLQLGTYRRI
jgi:hypothetical protein